MRVGNTWWCLSGGGRCTDGWMDADGCASATLQQQYLSQLARLDSYHAMMVGSHKPASTGTCMSLVVAQQSQIVGGTKLTCNSRHNALLDVLVGCELGVSTGPSSLGHVTSTAVVDTLGDCDGWQWQQQQQQEQSARQACFGEPLGAQKCQTRPATHKCLANHKGGAA